MLTIVFLSVLMLLVVIKIMIQGIFLIHKLQQLGYENQNFLHWLESNKYRKILLWNLFEFFTPLMLIMLFYFYKPFSIPVYKILTSIIMIITFSWKLLHPFISGWVGPRANHKKPLVYTFRVKRLITTLFFLIVTALFVIFYLTAIPFEEFTLSTWGFFQFNAFILFFSVVTPLFVLVTNMINFPVERFIHFLFYSKAKKKLARSSVVSIGITGSFGKTSTKFFLTTILSQKFRVLTTPSSYNTPMGISKVINDEDNLDYYDYFVAEMGAARRGEIRVLMKLVKPLYGILTAIGEQHLSTFITLENIIDTKLDVLKMLPEDGLGVYNADNSNIITGIKKHNPTAKLISYSVDASVDSEISAKNIRHTRDGLLFEAVHQDGTVFKLKTELLGRHNVQNLLAAVLMAYNLGLSVDEIERGVSRIEPVEHRLQKIDSGSGVLVLDDAFNSNVEGAKEALHVLKEIEGKKKIIVTPGFIELGEIEDQMNYNLGLDIASSVDIAILVGKEKTSQIYKGLESCGFESKRIYIVKNLTEAQEVLGGVLEKGDVVLFENDLPDTYEE